MMDFLPGILAKSPGGKSGNCPTKVQHAVFKSPAEKPVGDLFPRLASSRTEFSAVNDQFSGSILGTQKEEAPSHLEGATVNSLGNMNLHHSRGGTRTRDPGIMSAVL